MALAGRTRSSVRHRATGQSAFVSAATCPHHVPRDSRSRYGPIGVLPATSTWGRWRCSAASTGAPTVTRSFPISPPREPRRPSRSPSWGAAPTGPPCAQPNRPSSAPIGPLLGRVGRLPSGSGRGSIAVRSLRATTGIRRRPPLPPRSGSRRPSPGRRRRLRSCRRLARPSLPLRWRSRAVVPRRPPWPC